MATREDYERLKDGDEDLVIRHRYTSTVETKAKADPETGKGSVHRFTISTAAVDRHNDTVAVDGWDLEPFKQNPVVLWGHRAGIPPIGKATEVGIVDDTLQAIAQFTDRDINPEGFQIGRMVDEGFLNATSVGFKPTNWVWVESEDRPWGVDFIEQQLLEFSVVSIPANPEALVHGKGLEAAKFIRDEALAALEACGLPMTLELPKDFTDRLARLEKAVRSRPATPAKAPAKTFTLSDVARELKASGLSR